MRKVAPLLLLLAGGCAGCGGGADSRTEEVPEILRAVTRVVPPVPDRHSYGDVAKVKVGQWARYKEGGRAFTIAAVAKEGDDTWIEVIEEGETRDVSARLVATGGAVKKALFREILKDGPTAVVPQALEQAHGAASSPAAAPVEAVEEKISVAGRELAAKVVRRRSEDLEGRLTEEVVLWHAEVPPLYAGSALGGLVRWKTAKSVVELQAFGADARPLVDLPR